MVITGTLKKDRRTKNLVRRLKQGDIALIAHPDLDPVAAEALIQKKVAAVINTQPTLTGRFPTTGALMLLQHGIPIVETNEQNAFDELRDGKVASVDLEKGFVAQDGKVLPVTVLTEHAVRQKLSEAERNLSELLDDFVENTLSYLHREGKRLLASPIPLPPLRTPIVGRHALIVVRGHHYREDLLAIKKLHP